MKEIKWAVLGCGVIANEMAVALQKNGKNIYAVGNRTHEKAAAFAEKYGIGKVYDDFHEMGDIMILNFAKLLRKVVPPPTCCTRQI